MEPFVRGKKRTSRDREWIEQFDDGFGLGAIRIDEKLGTKDLSPYLREEYPFTSHYFFQEAVGGVSYNQHYLDEGTGPAIILVHGNPTLVFLLSESRASARL